MSCNYTRIMQEPVALKMYGFQSVSPQEMKSLIMRMQKPTHSTDMGGYFPEGYFKHPHRPTSGLCKRATPTDDQLMHLTPVRKRGMSPKHLNQVVRRLQTPTISRLAAEGAIVPDFDIQPRSVEARPKTAEDRAKFLRRITRPTTASKRKDMDAYWQDAASSVLYDSKFSEEQSANKNDIESIVDRVRTPTVASQRSQEGKCPKCKPSVRIDRDKLPLMSGLARSKRVDDIVDRLYRPSTSSTARRSGTPASAETSSIASHNR